MSRLNIETEEQYRVRNSAEARVRGLAKRRGWKLVRLRQSCGDWNWHHTKPYYLADSNNIVHGYLISIEQAEQYIREEPILK